MTATLIVNGVWFTAITSHRKQKASVAIARSENVCALANRTNATLSITDFDSLQYEAQSGSQQTERAALLNNFTSLFVT